MNILIIANKSSVDIHVLTFSTKELSFVNTSDSSLTVVFLPSLFPFFPPSFLNLLANICRTELNRRYNNEDSHLDPEFNGKVSKSSFTGNFCQVKGIPFHGQFTESFFFLFNHDLVLNFIYFFLYLLRGLSNCFYITFSNI